MNKGIRVLSVVGLVVALAATSFGQGAGPVGGAVTPGQERRGGAGGMKRMQEMQAKVLAELNLTADQKKQIKALDKQTIESMTKLREANKGSRPDPQAMREIMKSHREGLMKILTPTQQEKFKALMKEQREKMMKQRGAAGAGAPPPKP